MQSKLQPCKNIITLANLLLPLHAHRNNTGHGTLDASAVSLSDQHLALLLRHVRVHLSTTTQAESILSDARQQSGHDCLVLFDGSINLGFPAHSKAVPSFCPTCARMTDHCAKLFRFFWDFLQGRRYPLFLGLEISSTKVNNLHTLND